jgi:hypothetical protein
MRKRNSFAASRWCNWLQKELLLQIRAEEITQLANRRQADKGRSKFWKAALLEVPTKQLTYTLLGIGDILFKIPHQVQK